jgi:hypothetical protein
VSLGYVTQTLKKLIIRVECSKIVVVVVNVVIDQLTTVKPLRPLVIAEVADFAASTVVVRIDFSPFVVDSSFVVVTFLESPLINPVEWRGCSMSWTWRPSKSGKMPWVTWKSLCTTKSVSLKN